MLAPRYTPRPTLGGSLRHLSWRLVVVALLLVLPTPEARADVAIDHDGVTCIVAERFPRFEARFEPAAQVSRARLHFRPASGPHWYSVARKVEGDVFVGVTPKPKKSLKRVDYYIETTDTAFAAPRTTEFNPAVEAGLGACKDKVLAAPLSSASVLIEGPAGAPLVPVGFDPQGVVAASAVAAATTAAAVAGGVGKTALIVGGVAVGGVGIAAAAAGGGDTSPPTGGGPSCTAAPITSTLSNPSTRLRCGQPLTTGIVVSNGSCSALTIEAVQLTQNAQPGSFCSAATSQFSYTPTITSVAAGQTATVLNFQSAAFCCTGGRCRAETVCTYDETFAVQTSAGAVPTGSVSVQVSFDASCPICP